MIYLLAYPRLARENRSFWENIIDYLINVPCSCDMGRGNRGVCSVFGGVANVVIQSAVMWVTVDSSKSCSAAECLLNEWVNVHQLQGLFAFPNLLFPTGLLEQSSDCEQNTDRDCCSTGKYHLCTLYTRTDANMLRWDFIMHVFGSLTLKIVGVFLKSCR